VIYIENLLRPLQLFDFHLLPIYWLSLVFVCIETDMNFLCSSRLEFMLLICKKMEENDYDIDVEDWRM
jgi:hypothetical protein